MKIDRRVLILALVCAGLIFSGCGKKGNPIPQDGKRQFAWQSAEASWGANGCLNITARMTGATENVDDFRLELEAEDESICRECPFTPGETADLTPQQAVPADNGTNYAFTYCPAAKAPSYRWRLVAANVFTSFPHALTPVAVLEAPVVPPQNRP